MSACRQRLPVRTSASRLSRAKTAYGGGQALSPAPLRGALLAHTGARASPAQSALDVVVLGLHVGGVHKSVRHRGAAWELGIPHLGGSRQQVFTLLSMVARGKRGDVNLGCSSAVFARVERSLRGIRRRISTIKASKEADAVGGGGLVEAAQRYGFPRAVGLLNAGTIRVANGRSQLPFNGVVRSEVLKDLLEVPRAELPATRSASSEVVLHGDFASGRGSGRRGQDQCGNKVHCCCCSPSSSSSE